MELSAAVSWVTGIAVGNMITTLGPTKHHIYPRCLTEASLLKLLYATRFFFFLLGGPKFSPQNSRSAPSVSVAGPGWSDGHPGGKDQG